ncbi:hypothetical protein RKD20_007195 [Streptomyces sp. SLBN-8D4]
MTALHGLVHLDDPERVQQRKEQDRGVQHMLPYEAPSLPAEAPAHRVVHGEQRPGGQRHRQTEVERGLRKTGGQDPERVRGEEGQGGDGEGDSACCSQRAWRSAASASGPGSGLPARGRGVRWVPGVFVVWVRRRVGVARGGARCAGALWRCGGRVRGGCGRRRLLGRRPRACQGRGARECGRRRAFARRCAEAGARLCRRFRARRCRCSRERRRRRASARRCAEFGARLCRRSRARCCWRVCGRRRLPAGCCRGARRFRRSCAGCCRGACRWGRSRAGCCRSACRWGRSRAGCCRGARRCRRPGACCRWGCAVVVGPLAVVGARVSLVGFVPVAAGARAAVVGSLPVAAPARAAVVVHRPSLARAAFPTTPPTRRERAKSYAALHDE